MSLSLLDLISMTSASLRGNLLRSSLTTVGVFMGVVAVTASLQVRSISRAVIAQELAERDIPNVRLWVWRGRFRLEHLEFLQQRLKGWKAISGWAWFGGEVVFRDRQAEPKMRAVSQDFFKTFGRPIVKGRAFSTGDFEKYRPVAVIDEVTETEIFPGIDPIGKRVYVDGRPYLVVGVVRQSSAAGESEGWLFIPIAIHRATTGSRRIFSINIRPEKMQDLEKLGDRAQQLLQLRLPGAIVNSWSNVDDIREQQQTLGMVSQALLVLAGISLLVGGVGIANITIASVTERTKEIGLRRAIGATQIEVMWQFIMEALCLSLLGGVLAIATVHGLTLVVADTFELPYEFEVNTAAFSLGSALLVGVGAGFFPALQASKLDPVKALRS